MAKIKKQGRRFFLKSMSGVVIGLPFLEEFAFIHKAHAQSTMPLRFVTAFVPNGMPPDIIARGLTGPLDSLQRHGRKISVVHRVDKTATGNGGAHANQSLALFTGWARDGSRARGPSLDYYLYSQLRPQTAVDVMSAAVGGNNPDLYRWVRTWRGERGGNQTAVFPTDDPEALFTQIFGSPMPAGGSAQPDPQVLKQQRLKISVLDTIMEEYKAIMAPRSEYSSTTKSKISDHLDRIREVERQTLENRGMAGGSSSQAPQTFTDFYNSRPNSHFVCNPPRPFREIRRGLYEDNNRRAKADAIQYSEWCWAWPLICEVFALGLTTGYSHFGSLGNGFAGERYKDIGPEGGREHHEYYHDWASSSNRGNTRIRDILYWWIDQYYSRISSMLTVFDSVQEANGKSLLDNMICLVGPEMAYQHSCENMSYLVAGGDNMFQRQGVNTMIDASNRTDVDFYNTLIAKALNRTGFQNFGDQRHFNDLIGSL
jgi:hypothetical protein